jgi:pimeloyl-ACP methyl ester carboxylesterase
MTPERMVKSGDVDLAVYRWGAPPSATRPTVVLVHGYPDSAQVWNAVAERLAARCHVVAYDVRGAGRSSAPRAVRDYAIDHLVADLDAVLAAVSPDAPVHLACHDWGSIALWEAVTTPRLHGRIASYTTMSGPSLDHAAQWMRRRLNARGLGAVMRQFGRSWYMAAFQLPGLAPLVWKTVFARRWPSYLRRSEGAIAEPSESLLKDGVFGLNLYRANLFARLRAPRERRTELPVQLIVARRDRYVVREIFDDLPQWAPNLTRRDIDAGHWVQLSHPEPIADWIGDFAAGAAR